MSEASQAPQGPRPGTSGVPAISAAGAMAEAERRLAEARPTVDPGPPVSAGSPSQVPVTFSGDGRALFAILHKGLWLQILTLGLYRFWLITETRRFYWGHTVAGAEPATYTGSGMELFKGFLIALAVVLPVKAVGFLGALAAPGADVWIGYGVALVFLFLGQYAVYAGRRYRLTRTSWRGLRFRMTGSAWRYAVVAFAWWCLVILTLGLAYPWAATALERRKMGETAFGDAPGRFDGQALDLFRRGLPFWAIGIGLPVALMALTALRLGGDLELALSTRSVGLDPDVLQRRLFGILMLSGATGAALLLPLAVYPAFVAITARWWHEGLRIGGASLASSFSIGQAYRVYLGGLALIGLTLLAVLVFGAVLAGLGATVLWTAAAGLPSGVLYGGSFAGIILGYLLVLGFLWIAKAIAIDMRLWRAQANALTLRDPASLDAVVARNETVSGFGDSLGDAADLTGAF